MQNNITHRKSGHDAGWQSEDNQPIAQHLIDERRSIHHRRTNYHNQYQYHRQPYFVTIRSHQCQHFFGANVNSQIRLSEFGCVAHRTWHMLMSHSKNIERDKFIVMPNHMHAIIWCTEMVADDEAVGYPLHRGQTQPHVTALITNFKMSVMDYLQNEFGFIPFELWQEEVSIHAIYSERALGVVRQYILKNPERWHIDHLNSASEGPDPLLAQLRTLLGIRDTVQRELHRQPA